MNIHKHKSQSNNKTNNNNQLTPELNHHLIPSRNSRSLAQALPTKNKRWNSSSQKPAFTIIEVVLVLAIAGLIFLMVFIALPALQRNQRDTQRKTSLNNLEIGVVGFDWSAGCKGSQLFDDPGVGKMSTTGAFVVKLEGGGTYCVSNNNQ